MDDFATTRMQFEAHCAQRFANSPEYLSLIGALCDLYEGKGLLDAHGADRPLHVLCPRRDGCWGLPRATDELPADARRAGVAVPWVGSDYLRHRIVLMGINFNDWGGLDGHYVICESHQREQRAGRLGHNGRRFAFGAAAYVTAVVSALGGTPLPDDTPPSCPREVADAWDQCAFLEAVKCAPNRAAGEPYGPMWGNCVDLLLLDELEVLRPAVVLALGRTRLRDHVRPVLRERAGLSYGVHNGFERDTFFLRSGAAVELLSLNHPSRANNWEHSYAALQRSLRDEALAVAEQE